MRFKPEQNSSASHGWLRFLLPQTTRSRIHDLCLAKRRLSRTFMSLRHSILKNGCGELIWLSSCATAHTAEYIFWQLLLYLLFSKNLDCGGPPRWRHQRTRGFQACVQYPKTLAFFVDDCPASSFKNSNG
ncbi:hypothetical protein CC86DRAFT_137335 [Ophiobolus disseminans]|uniref:Uncharacterized protein n=1 Tax=Ophiobolus disseminans TaxID=1469910 RepID=A0A6A7ADA8_9PLEO|nr:hypothetical protein CC86DRAFT_137335 [Ophiobolus disseminans]